MNADITPEEKLLRLIKRRKTASGKPRETASAPGAKKPALERPRVNPRKIKEALSDNIYNILIFLLAGVIVYFLIDAFLITPFYKSKIAGTEAPLLGIAAPGDKADAASGAGAVSGPKEAAAPEPATPYAYFAKDITGRDIFKPLAREQARVAEDIFKKIKENLSLIGVIAGDRLQAAIEDRSAQKTYFVYEGDTINDVAVESVTENKVILNFRGEQFELIL